MFSVEDVSTGDLWKNGQAVCQRQIAQLLPSWTAWGPSWGLGRALLWGASAWLFSFWVCATLRQGTLLSKGKQTSALEGGASPPLSLDPRPDLQGCGFLRF